MSIKLNAQSGGSVALDAPTQTTSSADLTFKLPVADGSANQLLKTDGSGNLGWATDQGGKILKYETTHTNTQVSHSGTSYVDTGLSRTIQPSAASSKILVLLSQFFNVNVANPNVGAAVQVLEGSNVVVPSDSWDIYFFPGVSGNASKNYNHRFNVIMVHTPSYSVGDTLTYKTQMKALSDGNQTNVKSQSSDSSSYLTLMELAA